MIIKIIKDCKGSPNGAVVHAYSAGETFEVDASPLMSLDLATVFVTEGWAEEVPEAPAAPEAKATPENKAAKPNLEQGAAVKSDAKA